MNTPVTSPKLVSVIVAGLANTGKSTLAMQIHQHLSSLGLALQPYVDPDTDMPLPPEELQSITELLAQHTQEGRLRVRVDSMHLPWCSVQQEITKDWNPAGVEAFYQRGLLISAIDQFLRKAGVLAADTRPLRGEECLHHLERYGDYLALKKRE